MKPKTNLLSIIARLNTPVKSYFGPHNGLASLNPQPLPPAQIGAQLAEGYAQAVVMRLALGNNGDSQGNDIDLLDIWCPLGAPRRIPFKFPPW
jgi:hypothetical protein